MYVCMYTCGKRECVSVYKCVFVYLCVFLRVFCVYMCVFCLGGTLEAQPSLHAEPGFCDMTPGLRHCPSVPCVPLTQTRWHSLEREQSASRNAPYTPSAHMSYTTWNMAATNVYLKALHRVMFVLNSIYLSSEWAFWGDYSTMFSV